MNDMDQNLLAALRETLDNGDEIVARTREGEALPLSLSQQPLWFLQRFEPGLTAYNLPRVFRLSGALDADALERAFQAVVDRHAVLRTRFFERDGVALQTVLGSVAFALERIDLRGLPAAVRDAKLSEAIERTVSHEFDLGRAPALVARLIKLDDGGHVLAVCLHHIVSDAGSNPVFANDLAQAYGLALRSPGAARLPALALQYADYAVWQRQRVESGGLAREIDHWNAHLGPVVPALELPTDRARPARQTFAGAALRFEVEPALAAAVQAFCRSEKCTPFVALLAAWQVLLARHSGQADFAVGVPHAGRHREELQELMGFFVTTQVFRARLRPSMTLRQVCRQVRSDALAALDHADMPFELLLQSRKDARDPARNPLFQVMFGLQVAGDAETLVLDGVHAEPMAFVEEGAKFELSLDMAIERDRVQGRLEYNTDLFTQDTAERLTQSYLRVLGAMTAAPDRCLGEVELLGEANRSRLLGWGVNDRRYPNTEPVHRLIERRVAQHPEATALIFGDQALSYAELNARANRVAHRLIELGVKPETKVGLAVERSIGMVVGLLAVLKAGGAYVPLDPQYPPQRLAHMVEDSGIELLLTQSRVTLPQVPGLKTLDIDSINAGSPEHNPNVALHPNNLAYVIYTSGSTGQPKGIGIAHRALAEHAQVAIDLFGLTPADRMLQFSTLNFDGCIEQIYPPLAAGAAIVLRGPELWDSDTFHQQLLQHRISVADLTTAYWFLLVQDYARRGPRGYGALRQVHAGGEAMPPEGIKAWRDAGMSHIKLLNTYGPTEATVTATVIDCAALVAGNEGLPAQMSIGTPLPGRRLHVLDGELHPVPPGVAGELCIGGELLARAYGNRPALTAERFIADPFGTEGGRLYRTGDLVRWDSEGQLQYLGRIDHQVKLRGFRVELGEIEALLQGEPDVRQAVVLVRAGAGGVAGGLRLVAYASGQDGMTLDSAALRGRLSALLPDYMVPSAIVVLPHLPLNPNGKIDRAALPEPEFTVSTHHDEPQDGAEALLASVWAEVLRLERVGRDDNFFELGGDSILCLQIVARLRQAGWRVTPRQLFERQTIAQLASVISALGAKGPAEGAGALAQTEWPLLPIQAEFFAQDVPVRHHWNQCVLLRSDQPLDSVCLSQALQAVIAHHEALRLRFIQGTDGTWSQRLGGTAADDVLWVRQARGTAGIEALCSQAQRSLNLAQGPLLRALLIDAGADGTRLLLTAHHLAVDGVSWRILLEDLQAAYAGLSAGQPVRLQATTDRYVRWAQRLHQDAQAFAPQLPYWAALADVPVELPLDHPEGEHLAARQRSATLRLDAAKTRSLLQSAPAAYRTQVNDLLLAALAVALCRWSGHERLLIDLEGHGREDRYDDIDLSRTVGWFTTLHPLLLDAHGGPAALIKRIKERLRQVPGRGLGHGVLRQAGTPAQRAVLASLPRPRVVFNYMGQFDGSFDGDSPWRPADESAGLAQDEGTVPEHELSIGGQVYGGELALDIRYSPGRFEPASVQSLADALRDALLMLIDHCSAGPQGTTPSDFPLAALDQAELDALALPPSQLADLYPLSPMQTGMLFHSALEEGAYQSQMRVDIHGLDTERFCAAWQAVADRHEVLRTGFLHQRDRPLQWVVRPRALNFTLHDWPAHEAQAGLLDALAREDQDRGFDLQQPPLMRLTLVRTAADTHHFIWTCHHLLLDGWSASQLLGEVLRHYDGQPSPASAPYRHYIAWLQGRDRKASEAFWRQQLQALDEPCSLARSLPAPEASTQWRTHIGELSAPATRRLVAFAKAQRITVNTLVQAAWALLLRRCTGQDTVCFGATVSGRPDELAGADRMLGLFINTLPVICTPEAHLRLGEWLTRLQADSLAAREHEHTPLYEIQRWAGRPGQSLFDTLMVFENYPVDEALAQAAPAGLRFAQAVNEERTNYPLTLAVSVSDVLRVKYGHPLAQLSAAAVANLAAQFEQLLQVLAQSVDRPLGEIGLLTPAERDKLIGWGCPAPAWATTEPVHRAIERQAELRPHAVALLLGEHAMDFATLNRRANQLAHRLLASGVRPETRIGVVVERSLDTMVGLLAVLKAGAAYVPLDPDYPAERLVFMLQDSGVGWLLSHSHLREKFGPSAVGEEQALGVRSGAFDRLSPNGGGGSAEDKPVETQHPFVLSLSKDGTELVEGPARSPDGPSWSSVQNPEFANPGYRVMELDRLDVGNEPTHNPKQEVHPEQLAYVIYTSGSTGRPKGVAVAHGPLSMHCDATAALYEMGPDSREFHFLSLAFDGAHERWLTALRCGASLVLRGPGLWTAEQTHEALRRHGATHAGFPPSYLHQVADWARQTGEAPDMHLVSFGGEAMPRAGFEQVRTALKARCFINGYGPTEAVVTPLAWKTSGHTSFDSAYAPIGSPCGDRTAHVLDADAQPVPPGVAGELYLGGAGLARGYLGRPGLTAERFVPDPFSTAGGRLYRTGDWVRWRSDGEIGGQIEYLGRIDQQVKVRGFRIEIGEVEAQLCALPGVHEAVALARESAGGKRLLGYVTPRPDGPSLDPQALRRQLALALPDYMVPAVIVVLPRLPVTPNGKVDRPGLPDPDWSSGGHEAPQGEVETALAAVWAEVLGLPRVGRHDNFFELGGDSIISLQIVARVRRAGWRIGPKQLFECRTVAELARVAKPIAVQTEDRGLADEPVEGDVPLLPLQQRFLSLGHARAGHWNQSVLLHSDEPIDANTLRQALEAVLGHHDALRLRFTRGEAGQWRQAYAAPQADPELVWQRHAPNAGAIPALCNEAQRSLDLARGPLLRALLIEVAHGGWRLLLAVHHLVIDGVSWRIVLEDLRAAYEQLHRGAAPALPRKTSPFQQWARRLRCLAAGEAAESAARHWFAPQSASASWGADDPAAPATLRQSRTVHFTLDAADTHRLLREAPAAYRTQVNDLLLTALARAFSNQAGGGRDAGLWVDMEGHGREDLFDDVDLSRTVGWFTSVFPVHVAAGGEIGEALCRVKEMLASVPTKGLAHGVLDAFGDEATRGLLARIPRREVLFNYLGQFDGTVSGGTAGAAQWRLAHESGGESSDAGAPLSHELSFNGEVIDGVLSMSLTYSAARHRDARVQALLAGFKAELLAVIAHCVGGQGGVSVGDFPLANLGADALRALVARVPAPPREIEDIYPLTPGQLGLLDESVLAPQTAVNIVQMEARVQDLDLARLQAAWRGAVARHAMLRTGFYPRDDGEAMQVVLRHLVPAIDALDWRDLTRAEADAQWLALCAQERTRGFDLENPPLARWLVARVDEQSCRIAWTWHHLLLDGWSMSQLLGEVFTAYAGEALKPVGPRFGELVRAVRRSSAIDDEAYWQERHARAGGPTLLADASLPEWAAGGHGSHGIHLDAAATQPLRAFASAEQVTLNTLVQAAWALVLMARTGRDGATFGATMSGRSLEMDGIDGVMGLCINNLPVMLRRDRGLPVGEWLRQLLAANLELRQREHASPAQIQRWIGRAGQPLYDTLVIFENYPVDAAVSSGAGAALQLSEVSSHGALGTPLVLIVVPAGLELTFSLEYARDVFAPEFVADLLRQLTGTLTALVEDAGRPVGAVEVPAAATVRSG